MALVNIHILLSIDISRTPHLVSTGRWERPRTRRAPPRGLRSRARLSGATRGRMIPRRSVVRLHPLVRVQGESDEVCHLSTFIRPESPRSRYHISRSPEDTTQRQRLASGADV